MDSLSHPESTFDYGAQPAPEYGQQTRVRPKGKGHWQLVPPKPLPEVPPLPENPTPEDVAAHDAAVHEHVRTMFDNVAVEWIPDPEPEEKSRPLKEELLPSAPCLSRLRASI
jgi:hypothetical protein